MHLIHSSSSTNNSIDIDKIVQLLSNDLPSIAKDLIKGREDHAESENQSFSENPDDIYLHDPKWHQFGIVTHCLRAEQAYHYEVPTLLHNWGIEKPIKGSLSQKVDGITKSDLIRIGLLLHDAGKFTKRRVGALSKQFRGHEADSGVVISEGVIKKWLVSHDFTENQINYLARSASLHYELGKIREIAKNSALGFSLAFARSQSFRETAQTIIKDYPDFAVEIGILFLADNLSKVDLRLEDTSSDAALSSQQSAIESQLAEQNLSPSLLRGVLQLPVNVAVAEQYLKIWAGSSHDS